MFCKTTLPGFKNTSHTFSAFRKKYPSVTFKVHFATSAEIEESLLNQALDIGLLINFRERHRFHVFEVATEEHLVVTSPEYLKKINHLKDILTSDLIDINETFTCLMPWVQKHAPSLAHMLDEKKPTIIIPDFRAARELILLGQGIAVIPRYLIDNDLASGSIVQVMPNLPPLRVGVDCATLRGRRERLSERLFIEDLRKF